MKRPFSISHIFNSRVILIVQAALAMLCIPFNANAQVEDNVILQNPLTSSTTVYAIKSITLKPGFSASSGVEFTAKTLPEGYFSYTGTNTEPKNWTETKAFNGSQQVVAHSRSYTDWLGRGIQSQSADLSSPGRAVVSQVVYDGMGRQVISSLPAAIPNPNLEFRNDFFTDLQGKEYGPSSFDGDKLIEPLRVNASVPFGLGWYYSANNTIEAYVPESPYPYSRVEYSNITGQARRSAAPGEEHRMGMGRENYGFSMIAMREEMGSFPASHINYGPWGITKSISVDPQGKQYVTFTDVDGRTISTGRVGGGTSLMVDMYLTSDQKYIDIHIGPGCENSLRLQTGYSYTIFDLLEMDSPRTVSGSSTPISINQGFYRIACPSMGSSSLTLTHNVNYSDLSFYVYDKVGRLKETYSPKAVATNNPALKTNYKYNSLGWLIETNNPEEGLSQFVYRKDGSIKFSQNARQRAESPQAFSYTLYDEWGMPIESGEYKGTIGFSLTMNPEILLPIGNCSSRTFTFYDLPDNGLNSIKPGYNQEATVGRVSKTQNENSTTWYSYTHEGRLHWMVRKVEGMNPVTVHYTYNFNGNVTSVDYQRDNNAERFEHIYAYDANLRLTEVHTKTYSPSVETTPQAKYIYYAHGPLKRVEYGGNLQGVDYTYTQHGALKAINDPLLSASDPGKDGYSIPNDDFTKDIFGMALDYYEGDYKRTGTGIATTATGTNRFDGNIMAQRWRTRHNDITPASPEQSWLYTYGYDSRNYLANANFGTFNHTTLAAATGNPFSEKGLTYDTNGNMLTLLRYQSTTTPMDNLAYNYSTTAKPNQLTRVSDASADNTYSALPTGNTNFTYNAIGQMVSKTEGGKTTNFDYNPYGLVKKVDNSDQYLTDFTSFIYDENGFRVLKRKQIQGNIWETYYIRDASGNILSTYTKVIAQGSSYELMQEEIPIYGSGRIGVHQRGASTTTYELADHLGNVRALFRNNNGVAEVVGYTDYYPYGMPMPTRTFAQGSRYRFGYQGQFAEKDEETGYDHFEARQWDARLARWLAPDPAGQFYSPYLGMGNNPVSGVDPDGRFWEELGNLFRTGMWISNDGLGFYQNNKALGATYNGPHTIGFMLDGDPAVTRFKPIDDFSNPYYFPREFMGGVKDFGNQYITMKFKTNLANSDKYFHSKANFDASRRGPGGEYAAERLSNLREIFDQRIKGDSREESLLDQEANRYGRDQGRMYRNHTGLINYKEAIPKYRYNRLLDEKGL